MAVVSPQLPPVRQPGSRVRVGVWVGHMTLPMLALWLLLARPEIDLQWEHRPSHFWLVFAVAASNVAIAVQVSRAARLRGDARLLLVGYAFMLAAGFLMLHALATPGVIVALPNGGFEIATPVGLALSSIFFALAGPEHPTARSMRMVAMDRIVRWGLVGVLLAWGVVSLAELPPLSEPLAERAVGALRWMAAGAIALYGLAAAQLLAAHRRRPSVMLVALITAAVLLAEAMITIIWADRNWHLSWWLWHALMAAAFGFVAYSAYTQYRKEGAASGIFDGVVTRETGATIRQEYGGALETLTDTLQRAGQVGMTDEDLELIIAGLGTRFSLSEGQTEILARAARSLATERDQARRLGALAVIATEAWVERSENELLEEVITVVTERFSPDVVRIGLTGPDGLTFPDRLASGDWPGDGDRYSRDLVVGGERSGVFEFARPHRQFRPRDVSIMDTLVAEVGIALENVRLYRQLDDLFRAYISPDIADTLRADPSLAGLGGSMVEVTALFADLRGFTSFSEGTDPVQVMELLNDYFGVAVPIVLNNGGTVVQFVGDAMLAVFDAPEPRPEHELRAARTALEMQDAIAAAAGGTAAPRFRIGVNTGMALVGNIGGAQLRSFNVVGDAVNVASRLETSAEAGAVVIGETTYRAISDRVEVTPLGPLDLKGRDQPVNAYILERMID